MQERRLLLGDQAIGDRLPCGLGPRLLCGPRGNAQEAADETADGVATPPDAEVQRPAGVADEALLRRHRGEFLHQPRFADAGLAAYVDRLTGAALAVGFEDARELANLGAAADESRACTTALEGGQPPHFDRLAQALYLDVAHLARLDEVEEPAPDGIRDKRLAGRRHFHQPGGEVHGIAEHGVFAMRLAADAACDHLAAGDAGVDPERRLIVRAQARHRGVNVERGTAGALCIVGVRDRHAEQGHHGVADMLVDGAAVGLDDAVDGGEEAAQQFVRLFGIERTGKAGKA